MTTPHGRSLRGGFTLIELMVGLLLMVAVGGVAYKLLLNSQWVSRSQSQRIGMQDNGRSGTGIIENELREVGYDQISAGALPLIQAKFPLATLAAAVNSDVRAIGPDSITYRAMRGLGYTCSLLPGTADVVVIDKPADSRRWQAYRELTTSDSLLLYVENDDKSSADDMWVTVGLTAAPVAQTCADGVTAGKRFRIAVPAGLSITPTQLFANMIKGGPVRAFELMQVRTYTSGGQTWLGMRAQPTTAGTPLEPVIGPLAGATGLAFSFRDANNVATNVADNVRSVAVTLQPRSDGLVRTAGNAAKLDTITMTTRVALRNALRP
ncbi:MAG TPA: prepilin-type N-terminal cleavage/methylation domain-containing protein [Gemmatimonadales bacterium]|nr:prepilin-type N-terminal cleavage/methylation domain-containing protein [Gemmatimonadales bacterium]